MVEWLVVTFADFRVDIRIKTDIKTQKKEPGNILQESILRPKRPRIGHIFLRFRPRIGHIKPRDLAGVIKEETSSGSKSQDKS